MQSEKLHRVIAYTLFLIDHKIAVEEGDYLRAHALIVRRKRLCRRAFGYAVLDRPINGIGVESVFGNIGKAARAARLRAQIPTPEEGHNLSTGNGCAGLEVIGGDACCDAFFGGPHNGLVVKAAFWNIDKLADR